MTNLAPSPAPTPELPRLGRAVAQLPAAPPVRIVHLGLGNFHRAHQAWYTAHASDAADWGIAAFTGRRPDAADELAPQQGLYTLIVRRSDGDSFEVIGSLAAAHPATDHDAFLDYLSRPEVAVVTITVTEAGYLRGPGGRLDLGRDDVQSDLAALRADRAAAVATLPAKLLSGLVARRAAGAGPLTILSCDNLPHNGAVTATVVTDLADQLDPDLRAWIDDNVDFATSMVDRITPATTEADRALVRATQHYTDAAPVPTEPFSEWVISGRFPAGRPRWEAAGARLVDDVTPYERRKLWLLNGSHSLLAYAGSLRGYRTIDQAIADPQCRGWVELFWDEATPHLDLPTADLAAYRTALVSRFSNSRVQHRLAQIAADGSIKLPVRTVPPLLAERRAGRLPVGAATALAAWIWHLRGRGAPVADPGAASARAAAAEPHPRRAVQAVLATLEPSLPHDEDLVDLVVTQLNILDQGR